MKQIVEVLVLSEEGYTNKWFEVDSWSAEL